MYGFNKLSVGNNPEDIIKVKSWKRRIRSRGFSNKFKVRHGDNAPNVGLDQREDAGHAVQGGLDRSSPAEFTCLIIRSVPTIFQGIQRLTHGQSVKE